jgi:hypothetical protein
MNRQPIPRRRTIVDDEILNIGLLENILQKVSVNVILNKGEMILLRNIVENYKKKIQDAQEKIQDALTQTKDCQNTIRKAIASAVKKQMKKLNKSREQEIKNEADKIVKKELKRMRDKVNQVCIKERENLEKKRVDILKENGILQAKLDDAIRLVKQCYADAPTRRVLLKKNRTMRDKLNSCVEDNKYLLVDDQLLEAVRQTREEEEEENDEALFALLSLPELKEWAESHDGIDRNSNRHEILKAYREYNFRMKNDQRFTYIESLVNSTLVNFALEIQDFKRVGWRKNGFKERGQKLLEEQQTKYIDKFEAVTKMKNSLIEDLKDAKRRKKKEIQKNIEEKIKQITRQERLVGIDTVTNIRHMLEITAIKLLRSYMNTIQERKFTSLYNEWIQKQELKEVKDDGQRKKLEDKFKQINAALTRQKRYLKRIEIGKEFDFDITPDTDKRKKQKEEGAKKTKKIFKRNSSNKMDKYDEQLVQDFKF